MQFLSVNLKTKKLTWQEEENKDLVEYYNTSQIELHGNHITDEHSFKTSY